MTSTQRAFLKRSVHRAAETGMPGTMGITKTLE